MDDLMEYELRVKLSHKEQVERFGWCMCEGEGHIADDCPTDTSSTEPSQCNA
jgi:hypothetical protein